MPHSTWTPPALDPERELRDHLPEAQWAGALEFICARHGLDAARLTPYPTGSDVVWSTGEHVIKLTAPDWDWQIDAEAHWLSFVGPRLSVTVPAPRHRGELGGWPYLVMDRIPGVALGERWPTLEHDERGRLAGDLGRLVGELHGLPVDVGADHGGMPWDTFWARCREHALGRRYPVEVPSHLAQAVPTYLSATPLRSGLGTDRRVLLHTEWLDQHVLVQERAGRPELCGVIDFADARVGPAPYDVPAPVEFVFRGEPGLLRAFLLAYGCDPAALTPELARELLAWGLWHRYGNLARMLRALGGPTPASLEELAQRLYGVA